MRCSDLPPDVLPDAPAAQYRTIGISDIHLGTAGCKAEYRLDFLKHNEAETLYLVGDIIDAWQLKRGGVGFDGVVCGHIHKAEIREIDGILYCNDGDWVESLTALVESHDGALSIVEWNRIGGVQGGLPLLRSRCQPRRVHRAGSCVRVTFFTEDIYTQDVCLVLTNTPIAETVSERVKAA